MQTLRELGVPTSFMMQRADLSIESARIWFSLAWICLGVSSS
jgi:hypothetical protein